MAKKTVVILLVGLTLASVRLAEAQQGKKIPRIGYLSPNSPSTNPARIEAFSKGLRELGYVEGENISNRLPVCGGQTRSPPRACGRASASQGRSHRHE